MISDKQITRLSLVISLIGLVGLYFITEFTQPQEVKISDIDNSFSGKIISVKGKVKSFTEKTGNVFITLEDKNSTVSVIFFNSDLNFRKGDLVLVSGKITLYKNMPEILGQEIKKV